MPAREVSHLGPHPRSPGPPSSKKPSRVSTRKEWPQSIPAAYRHLQKRTSATPPHPSQPNTLSPTRPSHRAGDARVTRQKSEPSEALPILTSCPRQRTDRCRTTPMCSRNLTPATPHPSPPFGLPTRKPCPSPTPPNTWSPHSSCPPALKSAIPSTSQSRS